MKKFPVISKYNKDSQAMFGGLMAISLLSLSILADKAESQFILPDEEGLIHGPIDLSIYCFAIPCLAFCAERVRIDAQYAFRTHSGWIDLIEGCGIFCAFVGFAAILWYMSVPAAIIFIGVSLGALSLHVWYTDAMEKLNDDEIPMEVMDKQDEVNEKSETDSNDESA